MLDKYFELSQTQKKQLDAMIDVYQFWNNKINLISRNDLDHFYERHVLHSLSICKVFTFNPNTKIMDLGTGGGFPGVPLAIMFPKVHFQLVDSINKKTKALKQIVKDLNLDNIIVLNKRAEDIDDKFDFIVSRAVANLAQLNIWTDGKISKNHKHSYKNGLICLKGGDLTMETKKFMDNLKIYPISSIFQEDFFKEKKIIYLHK